MFTGIIQSVGEVRRLEPRGGDVRITIGTGKLPLSQAALGDSIAVNGVCLTAVTLAADAGPEFPRVVRLCPGLVRDG